MKYFFLERLTDILLKISCLTYQTFLNKTRDFNMLNEKKIITKTE